MQRYIARAFGVSHNTFKKLLVLVLLMSQQLFLFALPSLKLTPRQALNTEHQCSINIHTYIHTHKYIIYLLINPEVTLLNVINFVVILVTLLGNVTNVSKTKYKPKANSKWL